MSSRTNPFGYNAYDNSAIERATDTVSHRMGDASRQLDSALQQVGSIAADLWARGSHHYLVLRSDDGRVLFEAPLTRLAATGALTALLLRMRNTSVLPQVRTLALVGLGAMAARLLSEFQRSPGSTMMGSSQQAETDSDEGEEGDETGTNGGRRSRRRSRRS
jgi:hypothetical protein